MTAPAGWYPDPTAAGVLRWWNGAAWTELVSPASPSPPVGASPPGRASTSSAGPDAELDTAVAELREEYERLRREVVELRDVMIMQEVGIYQYSHPLDSAAQYKDELAEIEATERSIVKAGEAVSGTKKWIINGSEKDGAKMVADFGKLMLRAYNAEADNALRSLRPYAVDKAVERLEKMRQSISKLGSSMKIEITEKYHQLRLREIRLTADYQSKLADEKEREREQRARLREEEEARREFEREQARLEKEKAHLESAANALRMRGDEAAATEMEHKRDEVQHAIDGVVRRAANVRAGYVYVISNIGSFGDRVVKIGMTRRLDPMDRVRELGDASVPFRFDVHCIIFSEDAVGLESALHREFAGKRVNLVNTHREFFLVSPSDVRQALLRQDASLLTFVETPEALEFHQSATLRGHAGPVAMVAG